MIRMNLLGPTVFIMVLLTFAAVPVWASETPGVASDGAACAYTMCQYEKGNIDAIIIDHARDSQTIMFGEIHDNALVGSLAPIADSIYVTSLLPRLKLLGYRYLALEVNKTAPEETHSHAIVAFYNDYRAGEKDRVPDRYRFAKPGWIELVRRAVDQGYRIRFIDRDPGRGVRNGPRDQAMFETMKKEIFDDDPNAKVIVYIGAYHIAERETRTGIYLSQGLRRPLGYYLENFTGGRNFSVYMGHTYDTPEGCDLVISYFIWDTYGVSGKPTVYLVR